MNKAGLFFLLLLSSLTGFSQYKYTISGYIKEALGSESLLSATIYSPLNKAGTSSNNFGFYSITLPSGMVEISYSYIGFSTQTISFNLTSDTLINISLAQANQLDGATIRAKGSDRLQDQTQMSTINLNIQQAKSLPAFMGEVDLLKVLQLTPGVQSGSEGSSGLYVRGGGPDQNLILLDGVPVYNASHLFGFFSVFNADAINSMDLMKGGFPARYGGRISSVIDINMKEGNAQDFHGEGSISLIATKLMVEGPIIKDKTSFIVSGRRTYIDLLAKPFIKMAQDDNENLSLGYYFYDLTAKVNHKFSDKDRIFLSAYMGGDQFYVKDDTKSSYNSNTSYRSINESGLKWGNITTALRWNHIFTNQLFGNTSITYSRFRLKTTLDSRDEEMTDGQKRVSSYNMAYNSGIEDLAARINFDYLPSPKHHIRFGLHAIHHLFTPGAMGLKSTEIVDTVMGATSINGREYSVYIEDDVEISPKLKVNLGIHGALFSIRNQLFNQWQPRLAARYLINDQFSIKASYSRMAQYIHLLANSGIGLPTDLWVPTTNRLKPQTADQVALGITHNFHEKYELSTEVYYKKMRHVSEYKEGASFFDLDKDWERKVLQGDGRGYGIELFVQKKTGKLRGWVGYTLSWADRQFDEINAGKRFYYKYDRRHDLSVVANYKPHKKIELSASWVFGTGTAVTVPIAFINSTSPIHAPGENVEDLNVYSERNAYRMAPYHRFDASISFIKAKKWGERRWVIGVYNAYSRANPFYIDTKSDYSYNKNGELSERTKFVQYSLFPIIPSISYQFKF